MQKTFKEYAGGSRPTDTYTRNNTECISVNGAGNDTYNVLLSYQPQTEAEENFLTKLKGANSGSTESFFVPLYLATVTKNGKLITDPKSFPRVGFSLTKWAGFADQYGYNVGNDEQYILWLATIVSDLINDDGMTFGEAIKAVSRKPTTLDEESCVYKVMFPYEEDCEFARIVGFNTEKCKYHQNSLFFCKEPKDRALPASPFLIVPAE